MSQRQTGMGQLQRLKGELALSIKSSFAAEFGVTDTETKETLLDLTNGMKEIRFKIDSLQPEYGIGQFEARFARVTGIKVRFMVSEIKR
ncbi:hypothetical protein RRG08_000853 [Elysia crispata]|uniref:Uncharacterized protein n=1 Tax=Elysia crispata TaxID=231223 RepID=A0AAE0YGA2_9GAST|nr:hypothetical protein RRG08_000853 [Elysia crispata]